MASLSIDSTLPPDTLLLGCQYRFSYIDEGKQKWTGWKTAGENWPIAAYRFKQLGKVWLTNHEWRAPKQEKTP